MRVAPHSVEAEESVLGAMMISAEATDVALEHLSAEDFYRPSHQSVFAAVVELFDANEPVDVVTVTEALRRSGALERVGGIGFVTSLSDAVPTASNMDHYVGIVEEHALRRRLLKAAAEIGNLATSVDREITDVLDTAEQTVFGVSDRRVGDGLALIDPLLFPAIEKAEELSQRGAEVTGVSTGFRDLDRMLAGLHPTNLLIVAARPGMGKSALALTIAKNVAVRGLPVAIFSLEMSREEVVTRLLCSQGRIDSQRLRTGRLTDADFTRLSKAASDFYKKPVYVDDSPGLTVTEIRAKCRRLKRRPGLELVIVDYLQLMNSPGNQDNRQQEIATISRNLKNLARELQVPVIAVSQLNRSLETREDKRPRLGDLRECLTADTPIHRSDTGRNITIGEIARLGLGNVPVWSVDPATHRLAPSVMTEAWSTGVKPVLRITTRSGRTFRATANHPLLTPDGWRQVGDLAPGVRLAASPDLRPTPATPPLIDDANRVLPGRHAGRGAVNAPRTDRTMPAMALSSGSSTRLLAGLHRSSGTDVGKPPAHNGPATPAVFWDEIATIKPAGTAEVFDASVPCMHNFIAAGIAVHNSGAIEQDADVVMFIYRHEYYHPESSETKGLAEVHVAKHRQGAIGKIDMTFLPEFTLFADLGRDTSTAL